MHSLFGKRIRLSEQDHPTVIERGRGVEFHLQDVKFDNDDIPDRVVEFPSYISPPLVSPDGMTVFTMLSYYSRAGSMRFRERFFIVRHSLIDGQGSYFRITEFDDTGILGYALSNDRLGALTINTSRNSLNQYVIRFGHQPRLVEVTACRSLPMEGPHSSHFNFSLQLDDRIIVSNDLYPILILAADIEAPESNKYCHCCRLDGYYSRLENEAQNRNVLLSSFETLTLGRNGVYVCIRPRDDTGSFCVLGLEWRHNNELPEDLCHRRVEDTVPMFYRFDQQFANIHNDSYWFREVQAAFSEAKKLSYACHIGGLEWSRSFHMSTLIRQTPKLPKIQERITLNVFMLDLTRLVHGDAHPEMHFTKSTITFPAHKSFRLNHLNLVPGTSSAIIELGDPSSLFRLRSAFDVAPLRQLAFEAVYKHMNSEERSKPGWMQTLCGFECV